ncbi:serine hydrolase [Actibacterium sp. XHP0104]|uniref:serine hydrolase n=1 Tax=Actibacterium sp. XHP0104 TaxID=2984335 RepID=UPI0021E8366C|nr:serine hydrolase [Actibacterium sp. XHP0104]MCV2882811.1 serine hydrolase [Actibacterium sp. XHP0104]
MAAPYAAMVIDARSGEVLHSRNADTRLHPASLTKMMTLYIAFEAIEHGEISLDTEVTISRNAAAEPPSKLGLRAGQKIKLRYLIRAAAVKSANDAATAIGEAIEGSEAAFARRMNRTAKSMGMSRTTFKNANGLTEAGHLSTARDMTTLGRHVFYDYPDYYNLFSRRTADAGGKTVANTNRRFLGSYKGADGIKTGYTRAAGFNLVASAERGQERIIATVFGGRSSASRNAQVAELLDIGFRRAPTRVAVNRPGKPSYLGRVGNNAPTQIASLKTSPVPRARPVQAPPPEVLIAMQDGIESALQAAIEAPVETPTAETAEPQLAEAAPEAQNTPSTETALAARIPADATPRARPERLMLASLAPEPAPAAAPAPESGQEIVTRVSTSGGRLWGINVGLYPSRYQAERVLLQTALVEIETLDDALRKVNQTSRGFNANFVGMTREDADLACRRLSARGTECATIGPAS